MMDSRQVRILLKIMSRNDFSRQTVRVELGRRMKGWARWMLGFPVHPSTSSGRMEKILATRNGECIDNPILGARRSYSGLFIQKPLQTL